MTETGRRPAPHRCEHNVAFRRGVTNDEGVRIECKACGLQGRHKPNIPAALSSFKAAARKAVREGGAT